MKLASEWIKMTLVAVVVYLIVANAKGAAGVLSSAGTAYAGSVTALQGRGVVGNAGRKS